MKIFFITVDFSDALSQTHKVIMKKGGLDMDLQLQVREYLMRYGIKKKYLASLIGVHPSQLSQWLSGEYCLNANQIKIIEDFCHDNEK